MNIESSLLPVKYSDLLCPTAIGTGAWQLYLASGLYLFNGLFAIFELFLCIRKGAGGFSFRTCFFVLCAVFSLMRFFIGFTPLSPWNPFLLLFFVLLFPIYLQCVTFSLLVVFLARAMLVLSARGEMVRKYLYPIYGVLLVVFFIANIIYAWLFSTKWRPDIKRADFDKQLSIFWFVEFSTLLTTGGYSAYSTLRILHGSVLEKTKKRRVKLLFALSLGFFSLFLARDIYDILYYFGKNPIQAKVGNWIVSTNKRERNYYYYAYLVFYSLTEILPTFGVIMVIRTALPARRRRRELLQPESNERVNSTPTATTPFLFRSSYSDLSP